MSKVKWVPAILFLVFLWPVQASALCTVSTKPVNFGDYDVFQATPLDTNGRIITVCNPRETVTISIGPSPNSGGFDPRQMKHITGPDLLNYNVYINNNRTRIWGDGSGSTWTKTRRFRGTWRRRVRGRIPPGQDISAGMYTETLTVTITW